MPSWAYLMTVDGRRSISSVRGQPELHPPHWKQRSMFSPLSSSILALKEAFSGLKVKYSPVFPVDIS